MRTLEHPQGRISGKPCYQVLWAGVRTICPQTTGYLPSEGAFGDRCVRQSPASTCPQVDLTLMIPPVLLSLSLSVSLSTSLFPPDKSRPLCLLVPLPTVSFPSPHPSSQHLLHQSSSYVSSSGQPSLTHPSCCIQSPTHVSVPWFLYLENGAADVSITVANHGVVVPVK